MGTNIAVILILGTLVLGGDVNGGFSS